MIVDIVDCYVVLVVGLGSGRKLLLNLSVKILIDVKVPDNLAKVLASSFSFHVMTDQLKSFR